ncbi:hypothetical protein HK102_008654 [Quaeritorhiza haematococci]|nr:hypothetical protein HK102_008654 [Quaeritorhiza haematococci]
MSESTETPPEAVEPTPLWLIERFQKAEIGLSTVAAFIALFNIVWASLLLRNKTGPNRVFHIWLLVVMVLWFFAIVSAELQQIFNIYYADIAFGSGSRGFFIVGDLVSRFLEFTSVLVYMLAIVKRFQLIKTVSPYSDKWDIALPAITFFLWLPPALITNILIYIAFDKSYYNPDFTAASLEFDYFYYLQGIHQIFEMIYSIYFLVLDLILGIILLYNILKACRLTDRRMVKMRMNLSFSKSQRKKRESNVNVNTSTILPPPPSSPGADSQLTNASNPSLPSPQSPGSRTSLYGPAPSNAGPVDDGPAAAMLSPEALKMRKRTTQFMTLWMFNMWIYGVIWIIRAVPDGEQERIIPVNIVYGLTWLFGSMHFLLAMAFLTLLKTLIETEVSPDAAKSALPTSASPVTQDTEDETYMSYVNQYYQYMFVQLERRISQVSNPPA